MSCARIVRVGSSEEGDEHEPEPEPSFIETHAAFKTVKSICTHCRLAQASALVRMCTQMFHASCNLL
jgi:hypothetical protein